MSKNDSNAYILAHKRILHLKHANSRKRNRKKMKRCADCSDAVFHDTGSLVWVSCRFVVGWRDVNSECVLYKRLQK